jgi:hypothetical protein
VEVVDASVIKRVSALLPPEGYAKKEDKMNIIKNLNINIFSKLR